MNVAANRSPRSRDDFVVSDGLTGRVFVIPWSAAIAHGVEQPMATCDRPIDSKKQRSALLVVLLIVHVIDNPAMRPHTWPSRQASHVRTSALVKRVGTKATSLQVLRSGGIHLVARYTPSHLHELLLLAGDSTGLIVTLDMNAFPHGGNDYSMVRVPNRQPRVYEAGATCQEISHFAARSARACDRRHRIVGTT